MNKVYLDSNILVAYQIENHPFYLKAKKLIEKLIKKQFTFCLSPLALDEYLYIILKYFKARYFSDFNQILSSLKNISLLSPQYVNINWSKKTMFEVFLLIKKYRLRPRDAFHLKIIQEEKIDYLASFDDDFKIIIKEKLAKDALIV